MEDGSGIEGVLPSVIQENGLQKQASRWSKGGRGGLTV